MLSREDFYMIKQMRQQGAYIVDIATQIGCSERTVRRYLKYPEPPARKTRHKMVKLKPFMDYIDMRLAENVIRVKQPALARFSPDIAPLFVHFRADDDVTARLYARGYRLRPEFFK
ncbi:IS21 ORF1 [Shigella sonnei]|nr:IS21 ORF1 [Shigella sonnei]